MTWPSISAPPSLLAVDPGKTACGVALFLTNRLRAAAYVTATSTYALGVTVEEWWQAQRFRFDLPPEVDQCAIEGQQIYPGMRSQNPNDLLPLAYCAGAIHGRIKSHQQLMPLPRVWKGSLKKETMTRQILSRLHPDELQVIKEVKCIPSKLHNVIDACGLGLWALGALRNIPPDANVV